MPRRKAALTPEERERLAPIRRMATELIVKHLGDDDTDWYFAWNNDRRRIGVCKVHEEMQVGRIELSKHYALMNGHDAVRATLLHEIGHAIAGIRHGHDDVFRAACLAIGGDPSPCDKTAVMPAPKKRRYWACCSYCHRVYHRSRLPKPGAAYFCPVCPRELAGLEWQDSAARDVSAVAPGT